MHPRRWRCLDESLVALVANELAKNVTDDDVQRVASFPADAPSSLHCGVRTNLLCPLKVFRTGRQTNIRERS